MVAATTAAVSAFLLIFKTSLISIYNLSLVARILLKRMPGNMYREGDPSGDSTLLPVTSMSIYRSSDQPIECSSLRTPVLDPATSRRMTEGCAHRSSFRAWPAELAESRNPEQRRKK